MIWVDWDRGVYYLTLLLVTGLNLLKGDFCGDETKYQRIFLWLSDPSDLFDGRTVGAWDSPPGVPDLTQRHTPVNPLLLRWTYR